MNAAFKEAAEGSLKGILQYVEEPLVSIDFRGNDHSSIVDAPYTSVMDGDFVKVLAWYDNEWGYSSRCVDLLGFLGQERPVVASRTLSDLDVSGKRVLVRVDFNVPIKNGEITDDTRIRASLPTITWLLDHGATVILASHLGRPKGKPNPEFSLRPVAERLSRLLGGRPVQFAEDSVGEAARAAIQAAGRGGVVLLENLRFHAEEEKNDPAFAKQLAELADVYVNDAFGSAHRAHASTEGIVRHVKEAAAGLLMGKEVEYLGRVLENPDRPFVAVLGGAKVSDKLEVIENLISKVDALLIGGAMAYTFLKARGVEVGKSLVEADLLDTARDVERRARERGLRLELPVDHVVAPKLEAGVAERDSSTSPIRPSATAWASTSARRPSRPIAR